MQQVSELPILQHYVNSDGLVDYNKLANDNWIGNTWQSLEKNYAAKQHEITYWINVYNVLTLKSVQLEKQKNSNWRGLTSLISKIRFFYLRKFQIGTKKLSLYTIEFKILRKQFKDPRIHFAINCASKSCPFLPTRLMEEKNKDNYLDQLTYSFINEQGGVNINSDKELQVSKIFSWYKKDFGGNEGVKQFILQYWKGDPFDRSIKLVYEKYDWSLNTIRN